MKPILPICCAMAGFLASALSGRADLPQWYLDAGLPAADADGDGIPDAWEKRTFGDPAVADSALDRDGDGLTDLEEFVFGSDPRTLSTMGDGWSDLEKRGAGLDAVLRVVPTVTPSQWLSWLGWDAQTWQALTATNEEGFVVSHAGFVYNTPPYSEKEGTVDFWLETRTDRPAWLTVGDALTTNGFPVKAGAGRVRVRAAYGGPITLTLDPLPGDLAELPGSTNGLWLCDMSVLPARSNTVLFADGQTPPSVSGNPDSVDGLLMLDPPPLGTVHSLTSPPPSIVLQPLRMTAGAVVLGNGGWYCLCSSEPPCDWPNYTMIGCDAVSMAMNGVQGSDPILPKADAREIFWSRFPCLECTVTQTVANASYPFLYGRVVFSFRHCEAVGGVRGAEQSLPSHTPESDTHSFCYAIGCTCDGGPHWTIGFDHSAVNTRNILPVIKTGNTDVDTTEHCLGVVWSAGGKIDLFSLLAANHWSFKDDLHFTSDNLTVNPQGELEFPKSKPDDLKPSISLVKLHYAPNPGTDQLFDKLWVVVNSPQTEEAFAGWLLRNTDISWTTNLPSPFASISLSIVSGVTNAVDPEPNPSVIGGYWHPPESKNTYMHHDAKYEMRSKPTVDGHGHQAMYDGDGVLIENPIAAGTADIAAPINYRGQVKLSWEHWEGDVRPYIQALQLDGNPVHPTDINQNFNRPCIHKGVNTDRYIEGRPVLPTGKQP